MNVLQIGAPHSGNAWLWEILQRIRLRAELPNRSLARSRAVEELMHRWDVAAGRLEIDILEVDELGLFWRLGPGVRMPIADLEAYLAQCDHVVTPSSFCERTPAVLETFDRLVYLVRDPRDRALVELGGAVEVSDLDGHFEASLDAWRWHLQFYLDHAHAFGIHFVVYERLRYDLEGEIGRLSDHLGVDLDPIETREICGLSRMTAEDHPEPGGWHERLDARQKERASEVCGPLFDLFDYPHFGPIGPERLPEAPAMVGRV